MCFSLVTPHKAAAVWYIKRPVSNLVKQFYKSLEPKVYPIMCSNGAPMLSRNGIYFFKAARSYGNILLWGIVVVSLVLSPFIMILWHLGKDTLWEIPTQRLMPDSIHTYWMHTHTSTDTHMKVRMHASRHKEIEGLYIPSRYMPTHTGRITHSHTR